MKKALLGAALFLISPLFTPPEGLARSNLLGIRKSSAPEHTRVVLDLDAPFAYEDQSSADTPILKILLRDVFLPQGRQEVRVEDQVIRLLKVEPAGADWAEVKLLLYHPSRYKVFALGPSEGRPDRLVIDVFRPTVKAEEKVEEPPVKEPKDQKIILSPPKETPKPVAVEESKGKEVVSPKALSRMLDIRQWSAPDHTRVVIDLDGSPSYEVPVATDPLVLSVDLRGILLPKGIQEIPVGDPVIRKIRVEPLRREDAKVTLFLVRPVRLNVFVLKPYLDKPDRLVIDVARPDLEEKEKAERQVSRALKAKRNRIIVIDPGHGGEDPGAIGPRGTLEKDIVLALAKTLYKTLDGTGNIRAFMTRRGDYFVPLNERVKIAQEYGADLFISLHTNGSKSRRTRGSSIYCLSLKGASDQAAQLLAQKENASDMVGGISQPMAQRDLDSILLDLELTHAINESLQVGGLMLGELGRVNQIQFTRPRQAGFAVLKAPDFPSVLVETAYITHPLEETMLRRRSFQEKVCQAISGAVKKYLSFLAAKEGK